MHGFACLQFCICLSGCCWEDVPLWTIWFIVKEENPYIGPFSHFHLHENLCLHVAQKIKPGSGPEWQMVLPFVLVDMCAYFNTASKSLFSQGYCLVSLMALGGSLSPCPFPHFRQCFLFLFIFFHFDPHRNAFFPFDSPTKIFWCRHWRCSINSSTGFRMAYCTEGYGIGLWCSTSWASIPSRDTCE